MILTSIKTIHRRRRRKWHVKIDTPLLFRGLRRRNPESHDHDHLIFEVVGDERTFQIHLTPADSLAIQRAEEKRQERLTAQPPHPRQMEIPCL